MSLGHSPRVVSDGLQYHIDPTLTKSWKDRSVNIHPNPLDIVAWFSLLSGTNNCRISRETTFTSPVGGIPMKMETTGNDSHVGTYASPVYNLAPTRIGETWTVSVWARANKATTGQIFIFGCYNFGASYYEAPATTINITTEWQRFSYTYTMINAGSIYMQTRLDGADTFDGSTIWWDGLQVEKSSAMTTFTAKTSSALYDLSSNSYHAIAVNNPSYITDNSGILALDGVKDYITFPANNRPTISTVTGFTIGMWVYQAPTQVGLFWNYLYVTYPLEMGTYGTNSGAFGMKDNAAAGGPNVNTGNISAGWNYVAFGTNSSQIPFLYHYNATTSSVVTAGAFTPATYTIDKLFQGINGYTSYYGAKFGPIQIYNRALTAAEVLQNFNALRGRYGI
jgi:hypothetical protein